MGLFITNSLKSGDPIAKVPAQFFTDVDEVLTNLEIRDGYIERNGTNWVICPYSTDPTDTAGDGGRLLPSGGSAGDVLTLDSNGDPQWETPGTC